MSTRLLLRLAALMTAIQAVGHTFGGVLGPIKPGNQMTAVTAMRSNPFDAMGTTLTFWDAYIGFGLCVTVFLVMEAGLLWFLSNAVDQSAIDWRPLLMLVLVCNVVVAVLGVRYFFPATVVGPAINLICVGFALARVRPVLSASVRPVASGTMETWMPSRSHPPKSSI